MPVSVEHILGPGSSRRWCSDEGKVTSTVMRSRIWTAGDLLGGSGSVGHVICSGGTIGSFGREMPGSVE
eukprot:1160223-Pelagomonas_calceolata.AAC.10